MFALLDSITDIKIISDLILSYLPLRFIDYTNEDLSRIYRITRGFGGLSQPARIFSETVWFDRLCNPDSPNGIRLHAIEVLGELEENGRTGRPVPDRPFVVVDILFNIQHPSHSLCNAALRKIILSKQEDVTDQEYEYLNNHFCSQLLNIFYSFLEDGNDYEIAQSGIGEFIAHLIYTVGEDDQCKEIKEDLIAWIVSKLNEDGNTSGGRRPSDVFTKFVFSSNYNKFKHMFSTLDLNTIDPELVEKFRLHLERK